MAETAEVELKSGRVYAPDSRSLIVKLHVLKTRGGTSELHLKDSWKLKQLAHVDVKYADERGAATTTPRYGLADTDRLI